MSAQLIFDPLKQKSFLCPFTFLIKDSLGKKVIFEYHEYTEENLQSIFTKDYDVNSLKILAMLTDDALSKESKKHESDYRKLRPNKEKSEYVKKYVSDYYFKSFRPIFNTLSKNQKLYHKVESGEKRFKNIPCRFDDTQIPELSFKIESQGKKLYIVPFVKLNNEKYRVTDINRFQFMICCQDEYYMLKKQDWQVLEEIDKAETFSHQTYLEKYHNTLKRYPLDIDGVFEQETRETTPSAMIQISELGGDILLFLPRWDYDGTIVEDNKADFTIYQGTKRITYLRDKLAEQQTIEFLQNAHPKFEGQTSFFLKFEEASKKNWFFNFYHDQLKGNFTITGMDMLGYFRYSKHQVSSKLRITKTLDNTVVADFTTYFGDEKIDTKTLQKAVKHGDRFIFLKDSSLGILSEDWLNKYALLIKNAKVDGQQIQFAKWLLLVSNSDDKMALKMVLPEDWMKKWNSWNQTTDQLYEKSDLIQANLRDYQHKGYEWINLMAEINAGTLLADDMGLGKTLQVITSLAHWLKDKPSSKFLIITPASLIYNWKNEFEKFAPHFDPFIYHGSHRDLHPFLESESQVMITSYSIIRNDNELISKMYWDAIVLDESHNIKNFTTKQTQAVLKLHGKRRVILNGTPIMNNVTDLFPQLHFLLPGLFPYFKQFKDQFEKPILQSKGDGPMESLKKLTSPFVLRRTKEAVAPDLPQKTESVFWCEMEEEQRLAYQEVKS